MKTVIAGWILLCAFACAVAAQAGEKPAEIPEPALQELVLAERSFARASIESGIRDAFLEYLAADSVIFRPGPLAGRPWFEQSPPVEGTLSWEPVFADVSRRGDMGYTSGPWQFTSGDGEPAHGHYVSIWKKQDDGAWRMALDIGISHAKPEASFGDLRWPKRRSRLANRVAGAGPDVEEPEGLIEAERSYAEAAAESSLVAAKQAADPALRLYREGRLPAEDRAAGKRLLEELDERAAAVLIGWGLAESEDLGYTYGALKLEAGEDGEGGGPGSYLRIWKKNRAGAWKLVLDVAVPHPRTGG